MISKLFRAWVVLVLVAVGLVVRGGVVSAQAADEAPAGANLSCVSYYEGSAVATTGPRSYRLVCYVRPGQHAALMSRLAAGTLTPTSASLYVVNPATNAVSTIGSCASGSTATLVDNGRLLGADGSTVLLAASGDFGDNYFHVLVSCAWSGSLSATREILAPGNPPWPVGEGSISTATATHWGSSKCQTVRPAVSSTYHPWLCMNGATPADLDTLPYLAGHFGSLPAGPTPDLVVDDGGGCSATAGLSINPLSWVGALATVLRCQFLAFFVPTDEALLDFRTRAEALLEVPPLQWVAAGTAMITGADIGVVRWVDHFDQPIDIMGFAWDIGSAGEYVPGAGALNDGAVPAMLVASLWAALAFAVIKWFT